MDPPGRVVRGHVKSLMSLTKRKPGTKGIRGLEMVGDLNYPLERGWEPLINVEGP